MIFDAHGDILTDMYLSHKKGLEDSFKKRHLELYKQGGITHSIFVNWTTPSTENDNEFEEIFSKSFEEIRRNSDIFHIVKNYEDMSIALENNKLGIILGVEGVKQLKNVNHMIDLYNQGVRHASLTWNEVNQYATGLDGETTGLSNQGIELIEKMEELGMIIDLAHSNPITFDQILKHTSKPIIISHGNAKEICNHRRNYTDEQIKAIANRNGVIGVCGIGAFISTNVDNRTVAYMAKHIDYIVKLVGIDHVGLGLDVCYYLSDKQDNGVEGFKTIADTTNLEEELKKLQYTEKDINKIFYHNFARVVKDILK